MDKTQVAIDKAELSALRENAQRLTEENLQLKQKLERMNELLLLAQKARFGRSSEKTVTADNNQLNLLNEAESLQDHKASEPTEETFTTIPEHKRKPKRTMAELTRDLPVTEVLLSLPEDEMVCGRCGGKLKQIGKKFVRNELNVIPARWR